MMTLSGSITCAAIVLDANVSINKPWHIGTHEAGESFECSRDAGVRVDFDENILLGMQKDLQLARLVQRTIQ